VATYRHSFLPGIRTTLLFLLRQEEAKTKDAQLKHHQIPIVLWGRRLPGEETGLCGQGEVLDGFRPGSLFILGGWCQYGHSCA
jgi:hypothetical protein